MIKTFKEKVRTVIEIIVLIFILIACLIIYSLSMNAEYEAQKAIRNLPNKTTEIKQIEI